MQEKCKNAFLIFKMGVISQGQGHFKLYSGTRCSLPQAVSLPSFVGITKKDLEKSAKDMCLQNIIEIPVTMRVLESTNILAHILDPAAAMASII